MAGNLFEALREQLMNGTLLNGDESYLDPYAATQTSLQSPTNQPAYGSLGSGNVNITPQEMRFQPQQFQPQIQRDFGQQAQVEQKQPSLLDKFHTMMSDPERNAQIVMALNTLRGTPDASLAAAMQKRIDTAQATKLLQTKAQKAIAQLKAIGTPKAMQTAAMIEANPGIIDSAMQAYQTDALKTGASTESAEAIAKRLDEMGLPEWAALARSNHEIAPEIMKQVVQKEFKPEAAANVSAPQMDKDGNYFVTIRKPDGTTKVEMLNMKGQTIADELNAKTKAMNLQENWDISRKKSTAAMEEAGSLDAQLSLYRDALIAIDKGAKSGVIQKILPAFDAQTAILNSIAGQLGIKVINSATFGALSQAELDLALRTPIDLSLPKEELKEMIVNKMEAVSKLSQALYDKAYEMQSMPFNEYIAKEATSRREMAKYNKRPAGITAEEWYKLNSQQKRQIWEEYGDND